MKQVDTIVEHLSKYSAWESFIKGKRVLCSHMSVVHCVHVEGHGRVCYQDFDQYKDYSK